MDQWNNGQILVSINGKENNAISLKSNEKGDGQINEILVWLISVGEFEKMRAVSKLFFHLKEFTARVHCLF